MVIKTETCSFSEQKVYPGKGHRVIARDGRLFFFSSRRARRYYMRKIKGQIVRWTIIWRKNHKKVRNDEQEKRNKRRARKIVRGIEGITKDEIKRKQKEEPTERQAAYEANLREIKDRKAKLMKQKQNFAKNNQKATKKNMGKR